LASSAALLNPGVCIGGQQNAVDGKAAGGRGCTIQAALIVTDARSRPDFRAARQPRPHRIQMNGLHLLVVLLHRAQRPIKEASLEQASDFPTRTVDPLRRSIFDGFYHPGAG